MQKIIVDGDFGGDEMQLLAVLLGAPDKFQVLGVTAVHGNTNHDQVLENAGGFLNLFNADQTIARFAGARAPSNTDVVEGDNAHGDNGIGNVLLPSSDVVPASGHAVDFILKQLAAHPAGTVTITATGPLTNIALAFQKNPDIMRRVQNIIVMGGCTERMPAHDMPLRQGNITPEAEFNFYMAPHDADIVMQSGLPITLFPMNCTQHLTVTPQREEAIRDGLSSLPDTAALIIGMMKASEWLDKAKFDAFAFMHDIHTALYLDDPAQYRGQRGSVRVDTGDGPERGFSHFIPFENGSINVMLEPLDPDHLFNIFLKRLKAIYAI